MPGKIAFGHSYDIVFQLFRLFDEYLLQSAISR